MPVRNEAGSLDAALASVCSQATDATIEVIVVDDHFTDSSRSIIERRAARDEQVRLVSSPRRGLSQALNCGPRYHSPLLGNRLSGLRRDGCARTHPRVPTPPSLR